MQVPFKDVSFKSLPLFVRLSKTDRQTGSETVLHRIQYTIWLAL